MPIEKDSGNIDFTWKNNPSQEQEEVSFSLRFHKTVNYGQTVSFLNSENEVVFSVPATLFHEVSEHISQYMNVPVKPALKQPHIPLEPKKIQLPKISGKVVPMPGVLNIPKPLQEVIMPNGKKIEVASLDASDESVTDEEIYLPPGHDASSVEVNSNDPIFQSLRNQSPITQTASLTPEEILAEREKAKNNPNKKKGIQKRHTN